MENREVLNLKDVSFSLDGKVLFNRINLTLNQGEVFMLVGESGSGLSTFLRLISGLIKPVEGSVKVFGVDLMSSYEQLIKIRKMTGFVFQRGALISNMTLKDNIALPLRYHTEEKEKDIQEIVRKKLRFTGTEKYENDLPSQLSEEYKKRGGLARALALDPRLVFCDELNTGLEEYHSDSILNLIKTLKEEDGMSALLVSHNKVFDNNAVDRVGILKNGNIELI